MGLAAGIISIGGALLAVPNYFKPALGKGDLVAVIVDAKTEKAVSNATVEILTLNVHDPGTSRMSEMTRRTGSSAAQPYMRVLHGVERELRKL